MRNLFPGGLYHARSDYQASDTFFDPFFMGFQAPESDHQLSDSFFGLILWGFRPLRSCRSSYTSQTSTNALRTYHCLYNENHTKIFAFANSSRKEEVFTSNCFFVRGLRKFSNTEKRLLNIKSFANTKPSLKIIMDHLKSIDEKT